MSNWKHKIAGVDFSEYPLWCREVLFNQILKDNDVLEDVEQPPYAILWEDPKDLEAPVKVTRPSPTWWAMALHGYMLPPVWVYHELKKDEEQPDFKRHKRGHLLHETPPVGPMTEEEAMEYLIEKDLPPSVWRDYKGNRQILKIVPVELIPTDRTYRNSWKIKQEAA